jgi:hypothetical protein
LLILFGVNIFWGEKTVLSTGLNLLVIIFALVIFAVLVGAILGINE